MATLHTEQFSQSLNAPFFRGRSQASSTLFISHGNSSGVAGQHQQQQQQAVKSSADNRVAQRQQIQQRQRAGGTKSSSYFKEIHGGQQMQSRRVKGARALSV